MKIHHFRKRVQVFLINPRTNELMSDRLLRTQKSQSRSFFLLKPDGFVSCYHSAWKYQNNYRKTKVGDRWAGNSTKAHGIGATENILRWLCRNVSMDAEALIESKSRKQTKSSCYRYSHSLLLGFFFCSVSFCWSLIKYSELIYGTHDHHMSRIERILLHGSMRDLDKNTFNVHKKQLRTRVSLRPLPIWLF
jgi:hypothetical protein